MKKVWRERTQLAGAVAILAAAIALFSSGWFQWVFLGLLVVAGLAAFYASIRWRNAIIAELD